MIAETLARHPELSRSDFNIDRDAIGVEKTYSVYDPETDSYNSQVLLFDSIDQEYISFANELEVWKEIKGNDTYFPLDFDLGLYEQGESFLKASLRMRSSYVSLPEY